MIAFEPAPPVVHPAGGSSRLEVDLLPLVLSHVTDPQVAGGPVEGEPPRVPQTEVPDLGHCVLAVAKGVVGRDAVRLTALRPRIDPEELAQQRGMLLSGSEGVTLAS